jgi:Protein of unknown function (DUF2934)
MPIVPEIIDVLAKEPFLPNAKILPFVNYGERSTMLPPRRTSHMDQSLENRIRERAYEMWTTHGCVHGQAD